MSETDDAREQRLDAEREAHRQQALRRDLDAKAHQLARFLSSRYARTTLSGMPGVGSVEELVMEYVRIESLIVRVTVPVTRGLVRDPFAARMTPECPMCGHDVSALVEEHRK